MRVPILPIIDLLILLSWTTLAVGGVQKLVNMAMGRHILFVGFAPIDMLLVAMVFLIMALALIGRTWVRNNDPAAVAGHRAHSTLEAYEAVQHEREARESAGEPARANQG